MTLPRTKNTALTPRRIQAYLDGLAERERSPHTLEKYRRDLTGLARFLAGRPLDKPALLAWKARLSEQYAPATVNSMLAAVNGYLVYARLPQLRLRPLRIQRQVFCRQDRELKKAEYLRLVQAARRRGDVRLALVLQTICATGIRVSELQYITAEAVARGYAEVNNKGKRRTILLPRQLCRALQRYLRRQNKQAGPVFTTRTGLPLDRSNIWRAMKALCRLAGVGAQKVFPHNLRHLFARTYYTAQHDLVRLADLLGHASTATTRIYTMESGLTHARQIEQLGLVVT